MFKRFLLVSLIITLLSGCGFRLRGQVEWPAQMQTLNITGVDRYADTRVLLQESLRNNQVEITEDINEQYVSLNITRDESSRRVLAVDNLGRASQYELNYQLGYELKQADKILIPATTISSVRSYSFDPNQALVKRDEEQRIINDMRRDAVQSLLRSISIRSRNLDFSQPEVVIPKND